MVSEKVKAYEKFGRLNTKCKRQLNSLHGTVSEESDDF